VYVEPFGGAASVLCQLRPRPIEVYNDLDDRLVSLFRVLQDERQHARLRRRLRYTLYSLAEFRRALALMQDPAADQVDRAWALYTAFNQGFGGMARTEGDWGRSLSSSRGMATQVSGWWSRFEKLDAWSDRFRRVMIESRDAVKVIRYWDSRDTAMYIDPPYVPATRAANSRDVYRHEMSAEQHVELVEVLLRARGAVVLSGYDHQLYRPLRRSGWRVHRFEVGCSCVGVPRGDRRRSDAHRPRRTECVWINPRAQRLLKTRPEPVVALVGLNQQANDAGAPERTAPAKLRRPPLDPLIVTGRKPA